MFIVVAENVVEVVLLLFSLLDILTSRKRFEELVEGSAHEPWRLVRAIKAQFIPASLGAGEVVFAEDLQTAIAELQSICLVFKDKVMLVFAVLNKIKNTWLHLGGLAFPKFSIQSMQQLVLQLLQ